MYFHLFPKGRIRIAFSQPMRLLLGACMVLSVGGCYFNDEFRAQGPLPNKTTFLFPGMFEVSIVQVDSLIYSSRQNTDSIDNQYVIRNLRGVDIDSLQILFRVYNHPTQIRDNLAFEKVIWIDKLDANGVINASFNNAFKVITNKTNTTVTILRAAGGFRKSGRYAGQYGLFREREPRVLGKLNGYVDANGQVLLEFDTSSVVRFIQGALLEDGSFFGSLRNDQHDNLASLLDTLEVAGTDTTAWKLSLHHTLQFVEDYDSLTFSLVQK